MYAVPKVWTSLLGIALLLAAVGCRDGTVENQSHIAAEPPTPEITTKADALERIKADAPFPVYFPSYVPVGYSLNSADVTVPRVLPEDRPIADESEVTLTYKRNNATITIVQTTMPFDIDSGKATPVSIGESTGYLRSVSRDGERQINLSWTTKEISYAILGSPASLVAPDELIRMARSMVPVSTLEVTGTFDGLFFSKQERLPEDQESPAAEFRGTVTLVDGCLRMESEAGGTSALVLWPAGYELDEDDDQISVLDPGGDVVARLGEQVELSGGMYAETGDVDWTREWLNERMESPIPEQCSAPFWLVGRHPVPPLD